MTRALARQPRSADSTDTTTDEAEATEVYGEVTEVGEDSITINVGTLKEGQQPDGEKPEDGKDAGDKDAKADDSKDEKADDSKDEKADDSKDTEEESTDESADTESTDESDSTDEAAADEKDAEALDDKGEAPSMLDLTGESQTITVTDTTTYEKEAQPEKPDEAPADDQKADDSKDADSEDAKADDTDSTDESADTESTDETADSDSTDAGAADETTDESADASDKDAKPDDTKAPEMKTEAIAFSDIKVGDTIKVTLDADGKKEFLKTQQIYNKNKNLILISREKTSYKIMKENFKDKNVILNPDTVLYLNNTIHDNKFKREYIMTCLRNDKESVLGSNKEKLITDLKRNHGQVVEFDTVINKTVTKEERIK